MDTEIPDAIDILVDVETEENGEEVQNRSSVGANVERVNSQPKTVGPAQTSTLLASINEALVSLFEDYRRACKPSSDKGLDLQMSSQGNVSNDMMDEDESGDAMA
ncbi:cytochrome P450 26A1-like protein [Corchorus olitorius]|uniref:Cytochrome P450 26A1-like protein n=1 Tax=Corchorus olitorius TaxID=93759 RepID=A0A1R3JGA6_9ROSI|nr:cytochrome P450 26A1-like protein [Corchorus olitorius]